VPRDRDEAENEKKQDRDRHGKRENDGQHASYPRRAFAVAEPEPMKKRFGCLDCSTQEFHLASRPRAHRIELPGKNTGNFAVERDNSKERIVLERSVSLALA